MSYTIITKSGSDFDTNISAEQMLGRLCKEVNAKYFDDEVARRVYGGGDFPQLAFKMTLKEVKDTANKLKIFIKEEKAKEVFPSYKKFFPKGNTYKDFISILNYYIKCFEDSKGYKAI